MGVGGWGADGRCRMLVIDAYQVLQVAFQPKEGGEGELVARG